MKLVWKGNFTEESQLPRAELPPDAKIFREPGSLAEISRESGKLFPWLFLPAAAAILLRCLFWGIPLWSDCLHILGVVLLFPCLLLHELLHALSYPRSAQCEFWNSFRGGAMFVVSTAPVRKWRFVLISLLPGVLLGILPLVLWIIFPQLDGVVFTSGLLNLCTCPGDLLNIKNTLQQVPSGAVIQGSGLHSYWYMP